jgi:tRNA dimethylallyltransferase
MQTVVAVVGPTGTGKSQLSLSLARELNGEIIGADSRQIYRYMDIGTAKPTSDERTVVPHHLIDIIDPDQDFSLAEYQRLACNYISEIHYRNRLPLLVGGTGQYVKAVLEGWDIPKVAPDAQLRHELEDRAIRGGGETLYRELTFLDPEAARKIDPRNLRRVIRALEVSITSGIPFSQLKKKKTPTYKTLIIGLTANRFELYHRIDIRVDSMIEGGLIEEVRNLTKRYSPELPALSGIGYRQINAYLKGDMTLTTASEKIKTETHRFVRHQYNWFRLNDETITWFDIEDSRLEEKVFKVIRRFIQ